MSDFVRSATWRLNYFRFIFKLSKIGENLQTLTLNKISIIKQNLMTLFQFFYDSPSDKVS